MNMKESQFGYLNILRFVGAICIAILLHWNDHVLPAICEINDLDKANYFLYYISKNSFVFVEMFYLISGFLFAKVYIDRIVKKNGITFTQFITSRYIRIFPLVIISTIVMYFLHIIYYLKFDSFFVSGNLKIINLLLDSFFAGTTIIGSNVSPINGTLWYIGPLILCYIIAYLLTSNIYKKTNKNYLYIYVIPIIIGLFILLTSFNFFIFNVAVGRALISFFGGVLIGSKKLELFYNNLSDSIKINIKFIMFIIIVGFICIIGFNKENLLIGGWTENILTYSLFFFPLLITFLYDIKWINYLGNTKTFSYLSNISFGIYVWNFPIIITLVYLIRVGILKYNNTWQFLLISFIVHIIVSTISYYLIERKLVGYLKKKFILK